MKIAKNILFIFLENKNGANCLWLITKNMFLKHYFVTLFIYLKKVYIFSIRKVHMK